MIKAIIYRLLKRIEKEGLRELKIKWLTTWRTDNKGKSGKRKRADGRHEVEHADGRRFDNDLPVPKRLSLSFVFATLRGGIFYFLSFYK